MRPVTSLLLILLVTSHVGAWLHQLEQRRQVALNELTTRSSNLAPDPSSPVTDLAPDGASSSLLQDTIEYLQTQLDLHRDENASLLSQIRRLEQAVAGTNGEAESPATFLEGRAQEIRQLDFASRPSYQPLRFLEFIQAIEQDLRSRYPEDHFENKAYAYHALGILLDPSDVDLAYGEAGTLATQVGAWPDPSSGTLLVPEDIDLRSPSEAARLLTDLTAELVRDNLDADSLPIFDQDNEDLAFAARALLIGDGSLTAFYHSVQNPLASPGAASFGDEGGTDEDGAGASRPNFYDATITTREQMMFPFSVGFPFAQHLFDVGGRPGLNAAYADPPRGTFDILHPDLYLSPERPEIVTISLARDPVLGQQPLFVNTAGEFNTILILRSWTPDAMAMRAADGWRGDRYAIYQDPTVEADHPFLGYQVAWLSAWADEDEAQEFFTTLRKAVLSRHKIEFTPDLMAEGRFDLVTSSSPQRHLHIRRLPDARVAFFDTTSAEWQDALASQHLAAP
jgi:hypothetical protein